MLRSIHSNRRVALDWRISGPACEASLRSSRSVVRGILLTACLVETDWIGWLRAEESAHADRPFTDATVEVEEGREEGHWKQHGFARMTYVHG